jgi:hypothetical protein
MGIIREDPTPSRWEQLTGKGRGRSKYHNVKTNGYDSKAEAKRGFELDLLLQSGTVKDIKRQVSYEIIPKQAGERAAHYVADFTYTDTATGATVVEDVKGVRTAVYILKRKLMLLVHGVKIREIGR